jgi:hypothetical protein
MRLQVSVPGYIKWLTTYRNHVEYVQLSHPLLSMKMMQFVLRKYKWYISKLITQNIFLWNCFTHMNYKKVGRLVSCKLNHAIIWLIYLQSLYLYPHLINVWKVLICVDLKIYMVQGGGESLWIESHVFLIKCRETSTCFIRIKLHDQFNCQCYKFTQIQICITSSNGQLTSQTRQQQRLYLLREDQARTEVILGHRHHQNIEAHDQLANGCEARLHL